MIFYYKKNKINKFYNFIKIIKYQIYYEIFIKIRNKIKEEFKFLFIKNNFCSGPEFFTSKFKNFNLQNQKILNFLKFTPDFNFTVFLKEILKKIYLFIIKYYR